jgi:hypothetical protein
MHVLLTLRGKIDILVIWDCREIRDEYFFFESFRIFPIFGDPGNPGWAGPGPAMGQVGEALSLARFVLGTWGDVLACWGRGIAAKSNDFGIFHDFQRSMNPRCHWAGPGPAQADQVGTTGHGPARPVDIKLYG